MTRPTSAKAYEEITTRGLLKGRRLEAYTLVYQHPSKTASELALHTDMVRNDLSTRLGELRDMGVIEEAGERECTETHKTAITYIVTGNLPANLNKDYVCSWMVFGHDKSWEFHDHRTRAVNPSGAWAKTRKEVLDFSDIGSVAPGFIRTHDGTSWFIIDSKASLISPEVAETFLKKASQ